MRVFRKVRGWLLLLGLGGAVAVGAVSLSSRAATTKEANAAKAAKAKEPVIVMVTADPVTLRPIQRRVQVVGSLWGQDEVGITPKVEGRIVKIHKYVGDKVKPGDVLMEIEKRTYQLAVDEAKRSLELELSKIGRKEPPPDEFKVAQLPSVLKAVAQEQLAYKENERVKDLGSISKADRDKAKSELDVARANTLQMLFDAETSLALVRHKLALLATAQQRLDDTIVTVPECDASSKIQTSVSKPAVEYLVAQRNVSEGETVGTSLSMKPVYRLIIADPLKLQATVPERHINEVKVGQPVEIHVESSEEACPGGVAHVNPTVERMSRTFEVEILIRNPQLRLHAGSFAKAAILTHIDECALTVPEEAIVSFAGVTKLFVLRHDKAVEVHVEPGVRLEVPGEGRPRFWVEVKGKNLRPDDVVVTSGQSQLSDGAAAKIRATSVKKD